MGECFYFKSIVQCDNKLCYRAVSLGGGEGLQIWDQLRIYGIISRKDKIRGGFPACESRGELTPSHRKRSRHELIHRDSELSCESGNEPSGSIKGW